VVLTILLIASLAAAAWVASRWVLRRYDGLGRRRPFPAVSLGLALAAAVACALPLWLHDRLEHRLGAVASQLVGARVTVHCETPSETFVDAGGDLGYVRWGPDGVPEHRTVLAYDACSSLRSWLASDKHHPSDAQVVAVHVLTHEAMHMAGRKDEADAECAAMQRDAGTAQALGASAQDALALARRYWLEDYPRTPDAYRGDCGPGSAHDEHLPSPPW
jgi:hypothetical protein